LSKSCQNFKNSGTDFYAIESNFAEMENTALSHVSPDVLAENKLTINSFLKDTYSAARKQVQEGMNFIKEELNGIRDKTANCVNNIVVLPVNNFLKDFSQIEADFGPTRVETVTAVEPMPASMPQVVYTNEWMEENY
jgi:hypothetical protein